MRNRRVYLAKLLDLKVFPFFIRDETTVFEKIALRAVQRKGKEGAEAAQCNIS